MREQQGVSGIALRKLCYWNNPILREPCRLVEQVDDKTRELLADMAQTMYHTGNAVGLAANQIGVLQRLIVLDTGGGLKQLVNPEIVEANGRQICVEGCLSLPGRWARTVRPQRVRVRFLDKQGDSREMVGQGELAKCLCHEIDHLNGLLLPDRAVGWL
ncbi:MAG: peptide deformylase [Oscillospiraceae bacterium]|jgi:peptide deformylase